MHSSKAMAECGPSWWWSGKGKPELPMVALWWELIRRNAAWRQIFGKKPRFTWDDFGENCILENLARKFNPSQTWQELGKHHARAIKTLLTYEKDGGLVRIGDKRYPSREARHWEPPFADRRMWPEEHPPQPTETAYHYFKRLCKNAKSDPKLSHELLFLLQLVALQCQGCDVFLIKKGTAATEAADFVRLSLQKLYGKKKPTSKRGPRIQGERETGPWYWIKLWDLKQKGLSLCGICDTGLVAESSTASTAIKDISSLIKSVYPCVVR